MDIRNKYVHILTKVTSLLKKSLSPSKVDGHTDRVFCIVNHPFNPHEFVSSGWDNTLQVSIFCEAQLIYLHTRSYIGLGC